MEHSKQIANWKTAIAEYLAAVVVAEAEAEALIETQTDTSGSNDIQLDDLCAYMDRIGIEVSDHCCNVGDMQVAATGLDAPGVSPTPNEERASA